MAERPAAVDPAVMAEDGWDGARADMAGGIGAGRLWAGWRALQPVGMSMRSPQGSRFQSPGSGPQLTQHTPKSGSVSG